MRPKIGNLKQVTLAIFLVANTSSLLALAKSHPSGQTKRNQNISALNAGKKGSTKKKNGFDPQLSTDINFNDLTVRGLRQSPLGLTTSVESEKDIPKLIDYRTDYRDRVAQSATGR